MENNKLIIGIKFIDSTNNCDYEIELCVLRDISFGQLLDGVKYGIEKLAADSKSNYNEVYKKCRNIYETCITKFGMVINPGERTSVIKIANSLGFEDDDVNWKNGDNSVIEINEYGDLFGRNFGKSTVYFNSKNSKKSATCSVSVDSYANKNSGRLFYDFISCTSINYIAQDTDNSIIDMNTQKAVFYLDISDTPICNLGFITSTKLIFSASSDSSQTNLLENYDIIRPFNPVDVDSEIKFPEYNISTRLLYKFDDTPIDIIPPSDPPKRSENSLISMLLPSILTIGVMILIRLLINSSGSSSSMIVMSAAMGVTAIITTVISFVKQKRDYKRNLKTWKKQYQDYIDNLLIEIKERQKKDVDKLNELYPDADSLIENIGLLEGMYSRAPEDSDFLNFRVALSNDVPNMFAINGNSKNVIFSEASFNIADNNGNENLKIYLNNEKTNEKSDNNLCDLPGFISRKYSHLSNAPLLFSLKEVGALGIVDKKIHDNNSVSNYFISRMIFELCYYHSPEDLQFVVFYPDTNDWETIENTISKYKFMPHFHGLFPDKSQFIFDNNSANTIMSSLLNIISKRGQNTEDPESDFPHIIVIVFDEHGLKEHALAEYLPHPPIEGQKMNNQLGISFVFAKKYKEYLPSYCDDVVDFNGSNYCIIPRENINNKKTFDYNNQLQNSSYLSSYYNKLSNVFQLFSTVYFAKIAQNGKVPSSVSLFGLFNKNNDDFEDYIKTCWGINGEKRNIDVTRSLSVPVGKTETGTIYLDLHEKADGPHMLVAGTTGSGKTETVITYLLGLCLTFRPDELNLLLVDMKGGGFTKRLGNLPHVVGTVTDVEGDENGTGASYMLGRFLFALQSEIKRRKLLLNKMHVDSADAYIQACNNIEDFISSKHFDEDESNKLRELAKEEKLSHLILVVDEFTELKRFTNENGEIDYMGEITTIARVGRSLGIHIILISQNIEGAITDDIRVNTKSRLCLKVATKQASKEMIGTDLAASPYMPGNGRAYLLVGTGSKFEYFQSGYSGADIDETAPVEITLASKTGDYMSFYSSNEDNKSLVEERKTKKKLGNLNSQLEVIVSAIEKINDSQNIKVHQVFRSPLPRIIYLNEEISSSTVNKGN